MKQMHLIVLGSGTTVPLRDRGSPSFALRIGTSLSLFDIGPGTLRQLTRIGISHRKIDHIFITHFHVDHTADLVHFLFTTRNKPGLSERKPFTITGPRGLNEFLSALGKAYGKWIHVPREIMKIEEMETETPDKRQYENFHILSRPVFHTPESIAYRIEGPRGQSIAYSGDTGFCDSIVELARECDLLILECSFPEGNEVEGHLTPPLAGKIASLSGATKLLLVHLYPEALAAEITTGCRKAYDGEIILGRDLLRLTL